MTVTAQNMIDADTHVDETDDTWSYFPEESRDWQPRTIEFSSDQEPPWLTAKGSNSRHSREWFIDGQIFPHRYRDDKSTGTTQGARELTDVPARVAHMDGIGMGVQVIYPSAFLMELTLRPFLMVLLCQSYNRWLADRCAESGGRLRWVAMIPFLSTSEALAEMRWAKEHGAVGIFKRGLECGHLGAGDPLFWPIYHLASELDLPICIHAGSEWRATAQNLTLLPFPNAFAGLQGFQSLVDNKIAKRYPELRMGIIENASAWLPHVLPFIRCKESLADLHIFVTCEAREDLGYIISYVGDDNLIVGTDYTHADRSSVLDAHGQILARTDITDDSKQKITATNGKIFYGL